MPRKFMEGLIFGAGFAVSFIVLWYIAGEFGEFGARHRCPLRDRLLFLRRQLALSQMRRPYNWVKCVHDAHPTRKGEEPLFMACTQP